jgi:cell division protein FtsW (lipid II flippase)
MKKIKVIDRGGIYSCSPDIKKRYANPLWWAVMSVAGIGLVALWYASPAVQANETLSSWVIGLSGCGVCIAVTMALYYTVGDHKKPYHKPSRSVMERSERYFDEENSLKAAAYLVDGNFEAIARLPRAYQPLHLLVMYRSEGGEMLAAQLVDMTGVAPRAVGEIEIFEKGAYTMPESLLNN